MANFQQAQQRFNCLGLDLTNPPDNALEDHYPYLQNVRSDGRTLFTRPGHTLKSAGIAGQSPLHSIARLDAISGGTDLHVIGTGTHVATAPAAAGSETYTSRSTGFSGDPLALVRYRPEKSTDAWLYIGDRSKMAKLAYDSSLGVAVHGVGVAAPANAPSAYATAAYYKTIDLFESVAGWAVADSAGWTLAAPALLSAGPGKRCTFTLTALVQTFNGVAGITCVRPSSMTGIGVGAVLHGLVDLAPDTVVVTEVHRDSASSLVAKIIYDAGSTGLCSIQPAAQLAEIVPNAMILITGTISGGSEYVRVLDVVIGPTGSRSFRCQTSSARVAGDTIQAVASFVCHPTGVLSGTWDTDGLREVITAGAGAEDIVTLTRTVALDLSTISAPFLGSGAAQTSSDNDYVVMGFRIDKPENLIEGKILLDCDAATNDFTRNYFYRPFTASDLVPVTIDEQSAIDNRSDQVRKAVVERIRERRGGRRGFFTQPLPDDPSFPSVGDVTGDENPPRDDEGGTVGSPRSQTSAGANQWSQLRFRIRNLQRIGTDESRGLKNVAAIRIQLRITGSVTFDLDPLILFGGVELEPGESAGFHYRYRGRSSRTGATGNPSPPTRSPISVDRQIIHVAMTQHPSADVDKLDIERYGGAPIGWHTVATIANSSTPVFEDMIDPVAIQGGAFVEDQDGNQHFQPWPVVDLPRTGTCTVAGTSISDSGTTFNTSWAPGTLIRIGQFLAKIYRVISTSRIELYESLGSLTSQTWEIEQPLLLGQPLPCLWGPFEECLFSAGDTRNPHIVYWTNPKNPDGTTDVNFLEVTAPSEPILNGWMWNSRCFVATSERVFQLTPYKDPEGFLSFKADELPNGKGLFSRWGYALGDLVYTLPKGGVFAQAEGSAHDLTTRTLTPLFPRDSEKGVGADTNGVSAPNLVSAQAANLRLCAGERYLYFDYVDASSNRRTLVLDRKLSTLETGAWFYDQTSFGSVCHYADEGQSKRSVLVGGADGKLYEVGGVTDDGTAVAARFITHSLNLGDPGTRKRFGDARISVNASGATITPTLGFDFRTTTTVFAALPTTSAKIDTKLDIVSGAGRRAYDIALDCSWSVSASQAPIFYHWYITYLNRPVTTILRATDYEDGDQLVCKYISGLYIDADTEGVAKTVRFLGDDGATLAPDIIVNHTTKGRKYYPLATPAYAYMTSLLGIDTDLWDLYGYSLDAVPAPPLSNAPTKWDDLGGVRYVHGGVIDCDTNNVSTDYLVYLDEEALGPLIPGIQTAKRGAVSFSFATPVLTHFIKALPGQLVRTWKIDWLWNPEPELGDTWWTQQTNYDLLGWIVHGSPAFIGLMAFADVVWEIERVDDGQTFTRTIPIAGGDIGARVVKKVYLPAFKSLSERHKLTSSEPFRIYVKDTTLPVKSWGAEGPFQLVRPFGSLHRETGAPI